MDYLKIKKELLASLRGNSTQKEMSEKLGFRFNQYHKWESDIKWLRWDEFIDILEVASPKYKKAFSLVFTFHSDPRNTKDFVESLCPNISTQEIGKIVGHSEVVVRRWMNRNISPSLETMLLLINERTNNLSEFVSQITDIDEIPTLKEKYLKLKSQKLVEIQYPFAAAIAAAIQLEDYKKLSEHSDKWIADRILVSEVLVRKALKALANVETIHLKGKKYIIGNKWIQVPGLPLSQVAKIDHYWTKRCLDRYQGPDGVPYSPENRENSNIRSFQIAPVSEKSMAKIQKILKKTSNEILRIIQEDSDEQNRICIYVSHFFDVQDIKWISTTKIATDDDQIS
ncbi:MAG: hypothetical protein B7Y39_14035 [Bdellovibrio sp. 28-41-41]|nr:MAG: hypothetical protein B7Y39_14035 [Bdellovibrio sp. 28-41-41]